MTTYIHFTGTAGDPILKLCYARQPRILNTMTLYAIAPDSSPDGTDYLTPGKRYTVLENHSNGVNIVFYITDDGGRKLICLLKDCAHLGGDWTLMEDIP